MAAKLLGHIPKTKLCWVCDHIFYGGRCAVVLGEDGHQHEVHQACIGDLPSIPVSSRRDNAKDESGLVCPECGTKLEFEFGVAGIVSSQKKQPDGTTLLQGIKVNSVSINRVRCPKCKPE